MIYAKLCRSLVGLLTILIMLAGIGCGGGTSTTKNPTTAQGLIDPSGNWKMTFTDSTGNLFFLSALFNQTGAIVSGVNISEVGNGQFANPPTPFNCIAQPDVSFSNGLVANVSTFTGTMTGNFGTLSFTSTLNDAGTHTAGTYSLTPGAAGNCLGIALTGTFTGDEVPSMTGTWTGTLICTANCPTGEPLTTSITMILNQDDTTGAITGTYATTGPLNFISGSTAPDINDFISGANWQDKLADQNGRNFVIAGGPFQGTTFNNAGVTQSRTFQGIVEELIPTGNIVPLGTMYTINMSH